jgi:hypothetical protein
VLATVDVPNTGGFQNWTTVTTTLSLPAGTQNIRLKSITNIPWNINWLQFGLTSQSPLPVKFVYFNSQCSGGGVKLEWKTASEQNTSRFSVQRSEDGIVWSEAGSVAAAGQSNSERSYTYMDKASSGTSMYRIVEYDFDGRTTISTIARSSCSSVREGVSLYPNPGTANSSVNITLERSQRVIVKVVDSHGAVMQQKEVLLPSGNSTIPLNISSYSKGVYAVSVQYSSEVKTLKLIKN